MTHLVVSAYWLSLALIGCVLLPLLHKNSTTKRKVSYVTLIIIPFLMAVAALWALIALSPLFLWKLPVGVAVVVYLAMPHCYCQHLRTILPKDCTAAQSLTIKPNQR